VKNLQSRGSKIEVPLCKGTCLQWKKCRSLVVSLYAGFNV